MKADEWRKLIEQAISKRPKPVSAHTYLNKAWSTASRPVLLKCEDAKEYVVKGQQNRRMIVNDHIVGKLGQSIGAPVGEVKLVRVPIELIQADPALSHIPEGVSHGSLWISDCTERSWLMHIQVPENRDRFARLAVLYGWMGANDHQLVYSNSTPNLVYSVDHGHFFPGGPDWTVASLAGTSPAAPYQEIMIGCATTVEEIGRAIAQLDAVTAPAIAEAVAGPLDSWGISLDERIALAEYLSKRRGDILAAFAHAP